MNDATARANAEFAMALVEGLVAAGVRHAVTSPGSRNTPLVLAFEAHPRITSHTILDERVAGFVALGIGRVSGVPAALLCTSGSAGAHYLPAAIEAERARVPLVAITADRPPELHGCGAPQTIEQAFLLGRHARWFRQLGPPAPGAPTGWPAEVAAQAVAAADGPAPGPVQLNVAFREPLWVPDLVWPRPRERAAPRILRPAQAPDRSLIMRLATRIAHHPRGVILCGPRAAGRRPTETGELAQAVTLLARALGWPVVAEPLSGLRYGNHDQSHLIATADAVLREQPARAGVNPAPTSGEGLFRSPEGDPATGAGELEPTCVLRLGQWPTSKAVQRWLGASGAEQLLIDPAGDWHDPDRQASLLAVADPAATCRALARVLDGDPDDEWLTAWRQADSRARQALNQATQTGWWHGAAVCALTESLAEGTLLHVASSLAVRDLDSFTPTNSRALTVTANRGANGIDGTLATAWGQALARRRPVTVLTGDLAFLHDAGALLAARGLGVRATVVVLNNSGGGIFDHLPISQHPTAYVDRFATPQTTAIEPLCQAAGASWQLAASAEELREALHTDARAAVHVIELPIDRVEDELRHNSAWAAVARALAPPTGELARTS